MNGIGVGLPYVFLGEVDCTEGSNIRSNRCRRVELGHLRLRSIILARNREFEALFVGGIGAVNSLHHIEFDRTSRFGVLLIKNAERRATVGRNAKQLRLRERRSIVGLDLFARTTKHHVGRRGIGNLITCGSLSLLIAIKRGSVERVLLVAELCNAVLARCLRVIADDRNLRPHEVIFRGFIKVDLVKSEFGALEGLLARLIGFDDGNAVARGIGAGIGLLNRPLLTMVRRCRGEALHAHVVFNLHFSAKNALGSNVVRYRERLRIWNRERKHRRGAAVGIRLILQRVGNAVGNLFVILVGNFEGTIGETRTCAHGVNQRQQAGGAERQCVRVYRDGVLNMRVVTRANGLLVKYFVVDGNFTRSFREVRLARTSLGGVEEIFRCTGIDSGLLDSGLIG